MYRTIDAKFWTDQKIRRLSKDGKLFMLYLVTNPQSHLSGFYYLPDVLALHETGLKKSELDTLWHTLSSAGLAWRDTENQLVWVVNMLGYQGRGPKNEAAAAKQLQTFIESPLIAKFVAKYPQFADRVSIAHPAQDQFGTPEQEQEQEQEQDRAASAASAELGPNGQPTAAVALSEFTFPTTGKGPSEWTLPLAKLDEYLAAYHALDVLAEIRKARQWCRDNTRGRKTAGGMLPFLTRWLNKAQDSGAGRSNCTSDDPRGNKAAVSAFLARESHHG